MTPYELFDLMIANSNRIDIQWGLFITVHMAIFGGIIYVDRPLVRSEKIGALIIYSGFAVINYLVTRSLLEFSNAASQDIARYATEACCLDNQLITQVAERLESSGFEIAQNVLLFSHLAMAVLVFLSVIFDKQIAVHEVSERTVDDDK